MNTARVCPRGIRLPFRIGQICVLVVEENRTLCEAYREVFQAEGFSVDFAWDGLSARAVLSALEYDAVVANLSVPIICGPNLFRDVDWPYRKPKLFLVNPSVTWALSREWKGLPVTETVSHPSEIHRLAEKIRHSVLGDSRSASRFPRRTSTHEESIANTNRSF